jgi:hypothetical protein
MKGQTMRLHFLFSLAIALISGSITSASAAENHRPGLPYGTIAQVTVSGGRMAPGFSNKTIYRVDSNGVVTESSFDVRNNMPVATPSTQILSKLDNSQLRLLQNTIGQAIPAELIDMHPNGPTGADFPTVSYMVQNKHGSFTVAVIKSDAHTLILPQRAAYYIKNVLDQAIYKQR